MDPPCLLQYVTWERAPGRLLHFTIRGTRLFAYETAVLAKAQCLGWL